MQREILDKVYLVKNNDGMCYIFLNDKCFYCDNGIDLGDIYYILWVISKNYSTSDECKVFVSYGDDDVFNGHFESLNEIDNLENVRWEEY